MPSELTRKDLERWKREIDGGLPFIPSNALRLIALVEELATEIVRRKYVHCLRPGCGSGREVTCGATKEAIEKARALLPEGGSG